MAAISLAVTPLAATADPAPTEQDLRLQRLDQYFGDPQSPAVYRALNGDGDPRIEAEGIIAYASPSAADTDLLARIYPEVDRKQDWRWPYSLTQCLLDRPLEVLKDHIAALGANHPYIDQWMRVQHAVWEACVQQDMRPASPATALPAPLATKDPAVARMQTEDRDYQQAAFFYYRHQTDPALAAFAHVAA